MGSGGREWRLIRSRESSTRPQDRLDRSSPAVFPERLPCARTGSGRRSRRNGRRALESESTFDRLSPGEQRGKRKSAEYGKPRIGEVVAARVGHGRRDNPPKGVAHTPPQVREAERETEAEARSLGAIAQHRHRRRPE